MLGTEILPLMTAQPGTFFELAGLVRAQMMQQVKQTTVTYAAAMNAPADGSDMDVTVTNGVGFTITPPANGGSGQRFRFRLKNTSGGAMGAVTLAAPFKAPALVLPATGFNRHFEFEWTDGGTLLSFVNQSSADVPN